MTVQLNIHLESVDGVVTWWADTDDIAGFYAAADSLEELRERALAALADIAPDVERVVERLDQAERGVRTVHPHAA